MMRYALVLSCALVAAGCFPKDDEEATLDAGATADAGSTLAGPDAGPPPIKRIFVTSTEYYGDFAGGQASSAARADEICTTAAQGALLGGAWKAWLSTSLENAYSRMADVGPWFLVDGTRVFNNKANLTTTPLHAIDRDEKGALVYVGYVWTGTQAGGATGETCGDWRVSDSFTDGTYGQPGTTSGSWTAANAMSCEGAGRFYCLEQ